MSEEDAPASAGDLLRALAPGATSPKTLLLSLGALVASLLLVALLLVFALDSRFAVASLIAWGHGAVWLTTGTVQRLDSGLTDLAGGAQWGVFLVLWWVPVAVVWGVASSLLG